MKSIIKLIILMVIVVLSCTCGCQNNHDLDIPQTNNDDYVGETAFQDSYSGGEDPNQNDPMYEEDQYTTNIPVPETEELTEDDQVSCFASEIKVPFYNSDQQVFDRQHNEWISMQLESGQFVTDEQVLIEEFLENKDFVWVHLGPVWKDALYGNLFEQFVEDIRKDAFGPFVNDGIRLDSGEDEDFACWAIDQLAGEDADWVRRVYFSCRRDSSSAPITSIIAAKEGRAEVLLGEKDETWIWLSEKSECCTPVGNPFFIPNKADTASEAMLLEGVPSVCVDFVEAVSNGDIKSMERLVNVSEGAYSSITFPMIQNASYAIECSMSGRRQLIVTADIVAGNEEYAEGKHSFEVLESPAGIMLYERKETDCSDVIKALKRCISLGSPEIQPDFVYNENQMEVYTYFCTVINEYEEENQTVLLVRFWHDPSKFVPSDLREYRFQKTEVGYVLKENVLIERGTYPPCVWMV